MRPLRRMLIGFCVMLLGLSAEERRMVINNQMYYLRLTSIPCASKDPCGTPMLPSRLRVEVREYHALRPREEQPVVGRFEMPCPGECDEARLERDVERAVKR